VTRSAEQPTAPDPRTYAPPVSGYAVPGGVPGYGYPAGAFGPPVPVAPGGAPLAQFWQRLVAFLVDALIVNAILAIPLIALLALVLLPSLETSATGGAPSFATMGLMELLIFVIFVPLQLVATYIYFVRLFYRSGQTVGKRALGIRVVRALDGGPIDLRTARRRWVAQYASAAIAAYYNLADGLWQLWDQPYRQCLHDKCAETTVVQVTVS
jgi:uncharacterized RDD family membrane protein YckC